MSMLLQRGHGRILSGFFRVFSSEFCVPSLCALSVLATFDFAFSSFIEGVLGFTLVSGNVSFRFLESSSAFGGGSPS